jgi:hypothetical protein
MIIRSEDESSDDGANAVVVGFPEDLLRIFFCLVGDLSLKEEELSVLNRVKVIRGFSAYFQRLINCSCKVARAASFDCRRSI